MNSGTDHSQMAELLDAVNELYARVAALEKFIDSNDATTREQLALLNLAVKSLKTVIYGSGELRLKGLIERTELMEQLLEEVVNAQRQEKTRIQTERAKLRGIQIGLGLTGVTGIGTLATVLAQLYK